MKKETIKIGGMSCAACANRIEKKLQMDGVSKAVVNLPLENLTIEYDSNNIKISDIKKTIIELGFTVLETKNNPDEDREKKEKEIKILKTKFIIALIFAIPLLYIAMAPMISLPTLKIIHPDHNPLMYALLQLILTIPIIIVGYKFYVVGFRLLMQRSPNMDSLIAISTSSAFIYSLYHTYLIYLGETHYAHSLYYEIAGVIIMFILLGKTLESISKNKTSEAIKKLIGLAPKTALIERNNKQIEIPIEEVQINDIIIVKPGSKLPVDGIVTDGSTHIDESMLTGESIPVLKKKGDNVYAASINTNGLIKFEAKKIGKDTVLAQIIKLVEDAQSSKAPIAALADKVSGYFVPIVMIIALISGILWYIGTNDLGFSLKIFISVLVIACPCALGLATPTAIIVATGVGAQNGILIKDSQSLEVAHKINTIVLDKTGTITEGKPKVTDIITIDNYDSNKLLQLAASLEFSSEHPLGLAIVNDAKDKKIKLLKVNNFKSITGNGIEGTINKDKILVGNIKLMNSKSINIDKLKKYENELSEIGKTTMYVSINDKAIGIIAVSDTVKTSSKYAIKKLKSMGLNVVMLTGDNKKTANFIAKEVGINQVLSEVLPDQKSNEIIKLQKNNNIVAMVGDGINDAPALVQSDIGIAIGNGTDIAIESGDIVLMKSDLNDVITALELSNKTIKNIKQNLFWAFAYNIIGIPIAAGVLHLFNGPLLNPMFAALAMSLSSVSIVTNALRLKRFKPSQKKIK